MAVKFSSTGGETETGSIRILMCKKVLVFTALCFLFAVMVLFCASSGMEMINASQELDEGKVPVPARVSRSIDGKLFPEPGKTVDNNVIQRNVVVGFGFDPIYLQDKHKSASTRRVKKVLKSDEYWKFLNEKESSGKAEMRIKPDAQVFL